MSSCLGYFQGEWDENVLCSTGVDNAGRSPNELLMFKISKIL